jgi:hypothetical protein
MGRGGGGRARGEELTKIRKERLLTHPTREARRPSIAHPDRPTQTYVVFFSGNFKTPGCSKLRCF